MTIKPSTYQIFLTTVVIVIIAILVLPNLISPPPDEDQLKIAIIDSGCSIGQSSQITEYSTFTLMEYGYNYDDTSLYDPVNHGRYVCDIIISNTENVEIYSAKIANGNGDVTYDGLFAAVKHVIEEYDVDIINLSLGGEPYYDLELFSAFEAYANEKIFIAAIGNRGSEFAYPEGMVDWPASLPWVIGVGALASNGDIEDYSSYGRDQDGLFVAEFVDEGTSAISYGTSFAAPRITAKYANLWSLLRSEGEIVTPEKLHYLMAKSTQTNTFEPKIGWGNPNGAITQVDMGTLMLGIEEVDMNIRFIDEKWSKQWKLYSTDPSLDFTFSDSNINSYSLLKFNWGQILTVNFEGNVAGTHKIILGNNGQQEISYSYNVSSSLPDYKVLLDHRNSVNGFAHSYGEYSRFEEYFRNEGILIHQIQYGGTNLNEYDTVLVTEFGRKITVDREFKRELNQTLIGEYRQYLHTGGRLQITLSPPNEFNNDSYGESVINFGALVTPNKIPNSDNNLAYTSNLTNIPLFEGVISIGASGSAIEPINGSQTILGYYKATGSFGIPTQFLVIGVYSELTVGSVVVWSGSYMLKNDYFVDRKDNYDQFMLNYLEME